MTGGHAEPRADLAAMRSEYTRAGLDEADLPASWLDLFDSWMAQAIEARLAEPNAMVLATAAADGTPAARTVLAKGVDLTGVYFYTNYDSAKSRDLIENPRAAVTFPWYALQRQIHLRGRAYRVDAATTQAYWANRPRISQLGAWSSPQSRVVADRAELDERQAVITARFADTAEIPLPPHWGGWRLDPETVEFWQGRTGRMHDRLRYRFAEGRWITERIAP